MRFCDFRALVLLAVLPVLGFGAERSFNFSQFSENQAPPGFRSTIAGQGKPGDWRIVFDDVAPTLAPLTPNAPVVTKRPVLAQLSRDPAAERFPMFIFEEEAFNDFTLTTRFKMVSGERDRMAGIAFRIQNESNYYVLRASSSDGTLRFYKVVNGQRGPLIGPTLPIPSGQWHEMTIDCTGNQIRCSFNGQEAIPPLTDHSFAMGKIGFWTKSDSLSYFGDTKIVYRRLEPPAQGIVREMLKKYPRLLGLRLYVSATNGPGTRLIASKDENEIGTAGGEAERDVIARSTTYYGKGKESVVVTMPLRDRNGDTIAAARVSMKSFPGQTEENALGRAMPIVKEMQRRVSTLQDLLE